MFLIDSLLSSKSPDPDRAPTRLPDSASVSSNPARVETGFATESSQTAQSSVDYLSASTQPVRSRCSNWLATLVYPLARYVVLPFYFQRIEVTGRQNLPATGPVILAPTHRSRWDALLVPFAAGQDVTGRPLRFMVTVDEMNGIQGWFIRRLGGFPINTRQPAIAALRHSVELLQHGEVLVIFPEGGDLDRNRFCELNRLQPGLGRLALQAEASQSNLGVQIVPININYSRPHVPWRSTAQIRIAAPIQVSNYCLEKPKASAKQLTADLDVALRSAQNITKLPRTCNKRFNEQ